MISNQILQNTIEGLKGISKVDFCVLDTEGKELAATGEVDKNCSDAVLAFVESPADSQVIQGRQFFKIFDEQRLEYVLVANGDSEGEYMLGKIAAFQIQSLLVAYKERFDKDNFIKNLLLDNLFWKFYGGRPCSGCHWRTFLSVNRLHRGWLSLCRGNRP